MTAALPVMILAQNGDRPGEVQNPLPPHLKLPPSPLLSPEDALGSFTLPEGFTIELVASEPLVGDPVAMTFDPDGRAWVVEMRGYMPNIDGTNEQEPSGRVVVLEDANRDGKMDRSTVFVDQLVMPRAIALTGDGVIIAEPPRLWLCRDLDGDLVCDERQPIAGDYGLGNSPTLGEKSNPELASNGLMRAVDNWIYSAHHASRLRIIDGKWHEEPTRFRGQWGITQDNYGRLFFNHNVTHLHGELIPAHYLARNPNYREAIGADIQIATDQSLWPGRVNPGVNRGYQPNILRDDGTLAAFTAACGPLIYKGDNFPPEFVGNAFVCEPAANLVRRNVLAETDGIITARNAYDRREFLTSTDERFRPVNLYNAPDGCLYIVDFYRGLIQHRIYLTTYLRNQIIERGLDKPIGLGRIYRVVHQGSTPPKPPRLANKSSRALVRQLGHENGWRRDTGQRLLVQRNEPETVPVLRKRATRKQNSKAQLHALWTLEGLGQLDAETLSKAFKSDDPKVRAAAIRLSEPLLEAPENPMPLTSLLAFTNDQPEVQLQLALTLGETRDPARLEPLKRIIHANPEHTLIRSATLSSLKGSELEMLESLLEDRQETSAPFITALANCVYNANDPEQFEALFTLLAAARDNETLVVAALEGVANGAFKSSEDERVLRGEPIELPNESEALKSLENHDSRRVRELGSDLVSAFNWPGKDAAQEAAVVPLTAKEQERIQLGQQLYLITCGACHQPHGLGQEGLAPPLKDSDWVLGSTERLARIVLYGLQGPITIQGKTWNLAMPGLNVFDDEQLASILTYVRREWGHTGAPVDPEFVSKIREQHGNRLAMWTVEELMKLE